MNKPWVFFCRRTFIESDMYMYMYFPLSILPQVQLFLSLQEFQVLILCPSQAWTAVFPLAKYIKISNNNVEVNNNTDFDKSSSEAVWPRDKGANALRSWDPGFKTHSDHSLNLFQVVPGSTFQLHWFAFGQLGFLTVVVVILFCCFINCVSLALKSLYGERPIKY